MIKESKKIEFWNFLTTEKNQPRPKGITVQRFAVIKPIAIKSDLWLDVIERQGATERNAQEFYQSTDAASTDSRTDFRKAVRRIILKEKMNERIQTDQIEMLRLPQTRGKAEEGLKEMYGNDFDGFYCCQSLNIYIEIKFLVQKPSFKTL